MHEQVRSQYISATSSMALIVGHMLTGWNWLITIPTAVAGILLCVGIPLQLIAIYNAKRYLGRLVMTGDREKMQELYAIHTHYWRSPMSWVEKGVTIYIIFYLWSVQDIAWWVLYTAYGMAISALLMLALRVHANKLFISWKAMDDAVKNYANAINDAIEKIHNDENTTDTTKD